MKKKNTGGKKLAIWRREVGKHARTSKENPAPKGTSQQTKSVKFVLTPPDGTDLDLLFDRARHTFDVVEGRDKTSMAGLLCSLHLAGFSVFFNSDSAKTFRDTVSANPDFSETPFLEAFEKRFKVRPKAFTPTRLAVAMKAKPRGGKQFDLAQVIMSLCGKKADTEGVRWFAAHMAETMAKTYPDHDSILENVNGCLAVMDDVFKEYGLPVCGFTSCDDPNNISFAFDPRLMTAKPDFDSGIILHQVVAQKLALVPENLIRANELGPVKGHKDIPVNGTVKEMVIDINSNCLSWIFGVGHALWNTTDIDTLMKVHGIPENRREQVADLQKAFNGFKHPRFFDAEAKEYRKKLSGSVHSWVSNYLKRLFEIRRVIGLMPDTLPDTSPLFDERLSRIFNQYTVDEFDMSMQMVFSRRDQAVAALDILCGLGDRLPLAGDVRAVEEFADILDRARGLYNSRSDNDETALSRFSFLGEISIDKLNSAGGGTPDVENVVAQKATKLTNLVTARQKQFDTLVKNVALVDPVTARMDMETARAEGKRAIDARDLAIRWWTQKVADLAKSGTRSLADIVLDVLGGTGCFDAKVLRNHICGGKGRIYRSPFSTSKHQPLCMNVDKMDPVRAMTEVLSGCRTKAVHGDIRLHRDLLLAENAYMFMILSGLPDTLPVNGHVTEETVSLADIRPDLKYALTRSEISFPHLSGLFNLYQSEISGLSASLFRTGFTVKVCITKLKLENLVYLPKDRSENPWVPPAGMVVSVVNAGGAVPVTDTMDLAAKAMKENDRNLARQIPHDIGVCFGLCDDLRKTATDIPLVIPKDTTRKGCLTKPGRDSKDVIFKLTGPSGRKGLVDHCLSGGSRSEHSLVMEKQYGQETVFRDGKYQTTITPKGVRMELAIPFIQTEEREPGTFPLGKTIIGIDLGEAGIGYSVFDAKTFGLMESGTIRIKSVKNLITKVGSFRGTIQPRQKFQASHSTKLAALRDNAVGDIAHHITNLCRRFNGFPVLESGLDNLATGKRQLSRVYDRVLHLFTFTGDADAHTEERRRYWGAETVFPAWVHPFLMKDGEPLILAPGAMVNPYHTSKTCSVCGKDAVKTIYAIGKDKSVDMKTGRIRTDDGTIVLKQKSDPSLTPEEEKARRALYAKRKENVFFEFPWQQNGEIKVEEVLKRLASQMRSPQRSKRAKDTTQSLFHCPFEDCGHVMHADENAAINIVRKWLTDKNITVSDKGLGD